MLRTGSMRCMSTLPPAIEMPLSLGQRLASARKAAGLDQDQLATRWVVSRSTISRFERDQGQPDFDKVVDLSRISGWPLDLFANAVATPEPPRSDGPSVIDGSSFACTRWGRARHGNVIQLQPPAA